MNWRKLSYKEVQGKGHPRKGTAKKKKEKKKAVVPYYCCILTKGCQTLNPGNRIKYFYIILHYSFKIQLLPVYNKAVSFFFDTLHEKTTSGTVTVRITEANFNMKTTSLCENSSCAV